MSTTRTSPTDAQAKIEAVLAALSESWNRHDMVAYASHFCAHADFVNVLGMHLRGRSAIEAQHVAIHKTVFRNSQLQVLEQTVRFLTPEVVVAHVQWQMTGHDTSLTKEWQPGAARKGVLTAVLVPEGGVWRITALHNTDSVSVPALGS